MTRGSRTQIDVSLAEGAFITGKAVAAVSIRHVLAGASVLTGIAGTFIDVQGAVNAAVTRRTQTPVPTITELTGGAVLTWTWRAAVKK